ncbi:MAG: xylulokinase [Acidimicrobiaceae bacterium]|nr:xylulokinase [Acidimicrobiaceae bacterium]
MSKPSVVVTLDIGGSAAKATAYDVSRRAVLASTTSMYPISDEAGQFDPEAWWVSSLRALKSVVLESEVDGKDYLGVTVGAVRMPFVLVDEAGEPTAPALLNKDRRALRQVAEVEGAIGAQSLYEVTGQWAAPEFGLPKLLWVRESWPDAWAATSTVLQLHDWIVFRLSGSKLSEPSSAAMSQMLDVSHGTWSAELLGALDVPLARFPEVRAGGSRAEGMRRDVAETAGLPAGLPVHLGGGDTHLSALSTGFSNKSVPIVVAGTTGPTQVAIPELPSAGECFPLLISQGVLEGQWVLESNAGAMGGMLAQLAGLAALSGARLEAELVARGFAVLERSGVPLTVLIGNPFFGPDGWSRMLAPTVVGLRETHTGADVLTAAVAGSCFAVRAMLACLEGRLGSKPPFAVATGGMSTSAIWCQLLADVTGHEIRVRPLDQVAGLAGAALVAGSEVLAEADAKDTLVYESRSTDDYAEGCAGYERLYRALQLELEDGQLVGDARTR